MAPFQEEKFSDYDSSCAGANAPEKSLQDVCQEGKKYDDAFLYYSNDDVRIKTLKMIEVSEMESRQAARGGQERKTRISFELHDSLILEDLLKGVCDGDPMDIDHELSADGVMLEEISGHGESDGIEYDVDDSSMKVDLFRELLRLS
eukprot:CAMPEP_0172534186 /NCGR_PEP_ID=MMETSP1067-20121228/6642_1 /TAXON_ID=265564 ORGANISM="Thalassiosira punctigera, Strain Tpunct2005C2" /NCGR_SAMPLE_ID=MMETSP1067 /ASSEMBLY_ACC=CAM_ASM_000444 /LENGTH=146 /DNA_ID=CAMNT_0013318949 /DNA_START=113 /DNA_END=553 /DNA_ORIENTATION=+